MAVFERNEDGSLRIVSVTRCCRNCGGSSAETEAAAPVSVVEPDEPDVEEIEQDEAAPEGLA